MWDFWALRPFRFVRFDVPTHWGMGTPRADRKLTALARTLIHQMESTDRPELRMAAIERFLVEYRRISAQPRFANASSPVVRERVWHFVRNRMSRLFGYDPAFLGRVLEKNGI